MDNANCSTLSEVIVIMECATCYMLPCYVPDYSSSFTRRSLRNERSGAILTLQRRSRTVRSDSRHGWRRNNVCMFSSRGLAARIVAGSRQELSRASFFFQLSWLFFLPPPFREHLCIAF